MRTIDEINKQVMIYKKSFEKTHDFEEFRKNIHNAIVDIEKITPVTPFFSSYLFRMKLDCENMDQSSAENFVLTLENFMDRLTP
jgi:hypothetical protein